MARASFELSESDRAAIGAAVHAAEAGNSGEIVPFLAAASDAYEAAVWRGAVLGAVLCPLAAAAVHHAAGIWGGAVGWMALPPVAGALLGLWAARLSPGLRRALAGQAILEREVRQRAAEAFLAEEVFRTRDRTGILLFLSRFERRVVILADSGIHSAVPQAEWDALADELARGIGAGHAVPALIAAIERCGSLLRERRVQPREGESNELADGLRVDEP
jgi:putative membrane protein